MVYKNAQADAQNTFPPATNLILNVNKKSSTIPAIKYKIK
jgi:hypothetical protein